jgi:nodulation protein E
MNQRRVVVTGIGIISALGNNSNEFREALFAGRSGIDVITSIDISQLRFQKAAEVRGFKEEEHFDDKQLMLLERFSQFALVAAREAVTNSNVEWTDDLRERTAIITGTGAGGQGTQDQNYIDLYCLKKNRFPPLVVPRAMSNAAASHISMEFGISGPTFTMTTACSSSNHAIGQAFWSVRQGLVDMAITGGSETPLGYANLKAWEAMRVVSQDTCRPFSKNRSGMVLGEGGAMLVLENLESAQSRGAKIYAEVAGFGMSADAHHITQPSEKGAARAINAALKDADLQPEQIGYVNAHGTATAANDVMETQALKLVFGEHANKLAVSSTKSMHGHTLGAAGAIEAVATVLALHHDILPPTANFTEPDPQCDVDVIPNEAREMKVAAAISNSFAFGGLNASLVFKSWNG